MELCGSDSSFRFQLFKKCQHEYRIWVHGYDTETKVQISQWKSSGSPHDKNESIKIQHQGDVDYIFLILMELCELSLYPEHCGKLWILSRLVKVFKKQLCRKQPEKWAFLSSIKPMFCVILCFHNSNFCWKHYTLSSSILFIGLSTLKLVALPQSQNDLKGKCFESVWDTKAVLGE